MAAECREVHPFNPIRDGVEASAGCVFCCLLAPVVCQFNNERIIQKNEWLGWNVRYIPPAHGTERSWRIECQHEGRKEITPHGNIDGAATIAIKGTTFFGPPPAVHE